MNELMEIRKVLRRRQSQNNKFKVLGNRTDFSATKKMQSPPIIMPNYGRRKSTPGVPKTKVSRVLLYDNVTQQHMLDVKVAHIKIEKDRVERLFDLHTKSFTTRMALRRKRFSSASFSSDVNPETKRSTLQRQKSDITNDSLGTKLSTLYRNQSNTLDDSPGTKLSALQRNQSNTVGDSQGTKPSSRLKRTLSTVADDDVFVNSVILEKLRFPKLQKPGKDIVLNLNTQSGKTKTYYSSDESGLFQNLFPLYTLYNDVTQDPRFTKLETLLASKD